MKNILASAAAFSVVSLIAFSAPVLADTKNNNSGGGGNNTSASPTSCQNLSAENRDSCCAAQNWKDVVRKEDYAYCPPMGDENDSMRLGKNFDGEGTTTGSISNDNANGTKSSDKGTGNNNNGNNN